MLLNWQINKLAILEKLHQSGYCLDLTKDWLIKHYTYLNNISIKDNEKMSNDIHPSDIENLRIVKEAREFHELMMNPDYMASLELKDPATTIDSLKKVEVVLVNQSE